VVVLARRHTAQPAHGEPVTGGGDRGPPVDFDPVLVRLPIKPIEFIKIKGPPPTFEVTAVPLRFHRFFPPPATAEIGLDKFILSGHPHVEEPYAVGKGVLPPLGPGRNREVND
jgi:hypothetical protein